MAIIVDILIILFIILLTFIGYKMGLTKSLLKITSFILSLIIAFMLFRPISMYIINETQIDDKLEEKIQTEILNSKREEIEDAEKKEENEPKKENNIPRVTMEYINKVLKDAEKNTKEAVAETLAKEITVSVINICVIFIVFILSKIIMLFVKGIANLIVKIPVIKQIDKISGIIYGFTKSLLIIYFILAIISFASPILGNLTKKIQNSTIGSLMYNNNIILKFLL